MSERTSTVLLTLPACGYATHAHAADYPALPHATHAGPVAAHKGACLSYERMRQHGAAGAMQPSAQRATGRTFVIMLRAVRSAISAGEGQLHRAPCVSSRSVLETLSMNSGRAAWQRKQAFSTQTSKRSGFRKRTRGVIVWVDLVVARGGRRGTERVSSGGRSE
jgi:hypothetical protein